MTADKAERLPVAIEAQRRIAEAESVADLRVAFLDLYRRLGWKCLCRLFVLHQTPEEALRLKD